MSQSNGAFASGRRAMLLASIAACAIAAPARAQDAQPSPLPVSPPPSDAPAPEAPTSQPAEAQSAPASANPDDTIVVTGIRRTIQTSINVKRNETAIVDALSSDEIGDLPALSVGEAIQTITGATTHREKGGATEIAIRGLGPFLSNSTFNGREATNGSGDRSVNFNQFPSELINGIKIYKTQQANLVEGGVAGTIELETLKPLDYGKRLIQGEIKGSYSDYGARVKGDNGLGWRGTLSYVDQFKVGEGKIGISIGVQRNKTSNPEETVAGSSTWTACNATLTPSGNCTEITRAQVEAGTPYYFRPNSYAWRQISEDDQRDAVFAAVQWKPSDRVEFNADFQYSDRVFDEQRNDLNLSEMRRGLHDAVYDDNGVVSYIEGSSTIETNSTLLTRAEKYKGGGASLKWKATDRLTLSGDASYSKTYRSEKERTVRLRSDPRDIYGNIAGVGNQRIPYILEFVDDNFAPTLTVDPRFDITDHDLFSAAARLRRDQADRNNKILAGRVDGDWDIDGSFLKNLEFGARISRLTYDDFDDRVETNVNDRPAIRDANLACRVDFQQDEFLDAADGNNVHSWASFDPLCLFSELLGTEDPGRNDDVRAVGNRDVEERTLSGYVMANYESQLGEIPIRGNLGVRVVKTSVTSRGLRSDLELVDNGDGTFDLEETGEFDTVTIKSDSTRVLPSVNAIFELQPNLQLRLAGYRAMSRPDPSALGAGREINLEDGTDFTSIEEAIESIEANGSPRLKPLMSWNGDVSLEWYPNRDSIVAGALYYKRFSGGFIPVVIDETFNIGGEDVTVPVTQTANSDRKSYLWGLELTLANRFSWLPKPFDGLGAKISYNYAKSNFQNEDITYGDQLNPLTGDVTEGFVEPANVFGLSKHVVSAQAYYEKGPFSIQAIYNYRSNYYQQFVGGNTQLRYVRGNQTFDLRASLNLTKNISLRAEGVNLFNEPKVTDMPVHGSMRQYHYYGPRYFFGVRVKI